MNPDQWLEKNYLKEIFSGKFEHLKEIVDGLSLRPTSTIVTIAGTNGKGETARTLDFILSQSGKKTALLTSPHLEKVNERFSFSGNNISDKELIASFEKIQGLLPQRISYFEFLFLVFLDLVKKKQPDIIILEVGLGGRLDAINAVDADYAAITSISRDHQELLGKTYKKIFAEKAGVLRHGQKVYSSFGLDYLNLLMEKQAKKLNCQWKKIDVKSLSFTESNQTLAKSMAEDILGEKIEIEIKSFAKRKTWKSEFGEFDLYPSHNPEGIRKLFQLLTAPQYNNYDNLIVSFSERPWSDIKTMMATLSLIFDQERIYFYEFQHAKSLGREKQIKLKEKFELHSISEDTFSERNFEGRTLVTGSNYFLGHFIQQHQSR